MRPGQAVRARLQDGSGVSVGVSGYQAVTGSFAVYTLSVTSSGAAERIQLEVTP